MAEENEKTYSAAKYRTPDGAPADIVIFTITSEQRPSMTKSLPKRELKVLLIKRKVWPHAGMWALPGGFSRETESVYETARRELQEETGVKDVHMEYFNVYSRPGRDPRGWMISHAFFALVNEEALGKLEAADDAEEAGLFSVEEALGGMELAFDHREILQDALARVKEKMLVTPIAGEFLPGEFTLGELYQVIRTVVPDFEEANFIRKMKQTQSRSGVLEEVRTEQGALKKSNRYSQRAAQLYRFSGDVPRLSLYS
ncbi:NUDIX domain-containing protein [Paenibacillus aurantius]|uniref:NUDIX domain-containing protein n=1 Tax=Paenibacillus aurantius TaxID=2918900 RepID=A0AA96REF5_9BACL|nr:NUDIX domain-containing protein [Paenibacillus aurantius]WNQ12385.1 NUDIX domain-containing protein [Paenibacillus aurantius]